MSPRAILIVGGGPAGALCGERLARAGFDVTLFESRRGWEKPCGGGVTWKAARRYPFLLDPGLPKQTVNEAELISSRGRRLRLTLSKPILIYARAVLNSYLLARAQAAGCRVRDEHVTRAETNGRARLHTTAGIHDGDFLILAGGARSLLGTDGKPPHARPENTEQTFGYYVPASDHLLRVQFQEDFEGYLWSFPRPDHLSVGICGKLAQNTTDGLKKKLHRFMEAESIPIAGPVFSHLLPSLSHASWRQLALAGSNCARIGDAAGLVDSITGEGIYFALRSGELLAESLIEVQPERYPARVWQDFARDLARGARWQRTFYRGRLLGAPLTERMIQLARRNPRFRALLDDLFSGAQGYLGLRWRLLALLLPALPEARA